MNRNGSTEEQYEGEEERAEKRALLKNKLKWLDKEPRAAFFYFFYLALYFEKVRGMCVRKTDDGFVNPFSTEAMGTSKFDLTVSKTTSGSQGTGVASLGVMVSDVDLEALGKTSEPEKSERQGAPENPMRSESVSQENMDETLDKILALSATSALKSRSANGVSFPHFTVNTLGVENITGCILEIFLDLNIKDILGLTKAINIAWAKAKSDFPEAFSWMDIKDEKQCLWIWKTMQKKGVSPPVNPLNNYQRWHFICATFDFWHGWTHDQLEELKADRKKASQQFLNLKASPFPSLEHKKTLLSELEKAWGLKLLRRKEKADVIKLPAKITKQLTRLARMHRMSTTEMMAELIERESAKTTA